MTLWARDHQGTCIGAGAFLISGSTAELVGAGPSDYLDLPVDSRLSHQDAATLQRAIIDRLWQEAPSVRTILLPSLVEQARTPATIESWPGGPYVTRLRTTSAPRIDRTDFNAVIHKQSLRRCENRLARHGEVTCAHFRRAEDILPRLDPFFDQHVRRWKHSGPASLFEDPANRELYRRITVELSDSDSLRFTEIKCDGRLVAAHFGFFHDGQFIWYKPSYEVELARLSPGLVLLRRLFELARQEDAREFDFTIGEEDFKSRYATSQRDVAYLHLTKSPLGALSLRTKMRLRRWGRYVLERVGAIRPRMGWTALPGMLPTELTGG